MIVDLSPYADAIEQAIRPMLAVCGTREPLFDKAAQAAACMPESLCNRLVETLSAQREGGILIKGLPTPEGTDEASSRRGNAYIALLSRCFGEIVGYRQEHDGALIHDIHPTRGDADKQSASGSAVLLELHTERSFHPFLPDYVLLYCVRPDHDGEAATLLVGVDRLLACLPDAIVEMLFQPVFRTGIDYVFGNLETTKGNGPVMSILYGDRAAPCIRYDADLMVGLSDEAGHALSVVREVAMREATHIRLRLGDLLVVDNRRAVHGRSSFRPRYDGRDRWLKRAHVVADFQRSAAERRPGSRVIETRWA